MTFLFIMNISKLIRGAACSYIFMKEHLLCIYECFTVSCEALLSGFGTARCYFS